MHTHTALTKMHYRSTDTERPHMAGILCPRFAFFHSASWRNLRVAAPSSVTFLHLHTNSRLILPIWPPLAFRGQIKGSRGTCSTGGGDKGESADEGPAEARCGAFIPLIFKQLRGRSCVTQNSLQRRAERNLQKVTRPFASGPQQSGENGENLRMEHQKRMM